MTSRLNKRLLAGALVVALTGTTILWLTVPDFESIRAGYHSSDLYILDRNNKALQQLRVDKTFRRLEWTPLDKISQDLTRAIIRIEDQRFFGHIGIDPMAMGSIARSFLNSDARWRGGSTITMQTVNLLFPKLVGTGSHRFFAKAAQMILAPILDLKWSKSEILEAYLNLISFRGELQGVSAATKGLLGKSAAHLTTNEIAILTSLVAMPSSDPSKIKTRSCRVRKLLYSDDAPKSCDDIDADVTRALSLRLAKYLEADDAPIFARTFFANLDSAAVSLETHRPRYVVSTIDSTLQRSVSEILRSQIQSLNSKNVHDGAAIVVDNLTGEVLAYVGNGGEEWSTAQDVDGIQAYRQAGSILKPLIFSIGIDRKYLTVSTLLDDSPLEIAETQGIYRPENFNHKFLGLVPARYALAGSMNIPAIRVLKMVGEDQFVDALKLMNFENLMPGSSYGPSMALGSVDVNLWSVVNSFRMLANFGTWSPLTVVPVASKSKGISIISPEAAFIVGDILSDRASRAITFGLENSLSTKFWTAVKTGTSKDMRDNWCVGFSDRYTVGVWMGNFNGDSMWDVTGVTGAAPVWIDIMNYLHTDQISLPPKPPTTLVWSRTPSTPNGPLTGPSSKGTVARTNDWYLNGTEPNLEIDASTLESVTERKILYPADGATFAIDPNIPDISERIFFEADIPPNAKGTRWTLNGKDLGFVDGIKLWKPEPGNYELRLVDENGLVLSHVRFSVKGSGNKIGI